LDETDSFRPRWLVLRQSPVVTSPLRKTCLLSPCCSDCLTSYSPFEPKCLAIITFFSTRFAFTSAVQQTTRLFFVILKTTWIKSMHAPFSPRWTSLIVALLIACSFLGNLAAEERQWQSADGRTMSATFVKLSGEEATFI